MMKMGSLSEAHIASSHSGNEVIGIHPTKTEGRTHMLIHSTTHKPVSEFVKLPFGETPSCKAFAEITFSSGKLIGPSCLYIESLW